MMNKNYSSYEEIERDLQILSVEREIHKQKILKSFNQTKDGLSNLTAVNIFKTAVSSITKTGLTLGRSKGVKGIIYTYLLQYVMKKIFRR